MPAGGVEGVSADIVRLWTMRPAESPESVARRAARPGAGGVVSRPGLWERLRNLYAKLGVHSRAEAVESARTLGLLAPSART